MLNNNKRSFYAFMLALTLTLAAFTAYAHKFFTSITQMEYNTKTKSVEIIMNVFTDDWEKALSAKFNKAVKIEDKDIEPLSLAYLTNTFILKNKASQIKTLQMVGVEVKADIASIYLEIKMPEGLNKATLTDEVLINEFADQNNIVNIKQGEKASTLVFKRGNKILVIN